MTRVLGATELKATLLAVLDDVAAGEQVEITKHGRLVARLVPATGPQGLRGSMTGRASSSAGDEELFSTGQAWSAS